MPQDLDDLNGEVMLLRWGKDSAGQELDASKHKLNMAGLADGEPKQSLASPRSIDDVPALEPTPHALKAKAYMAQVTPIPLIPTLIPTLNPSQALSQPLANPKPNPNPSPNQMMRFGPDGVGALRAYTFITGRNGSKLP